jgi:hypothetical protein
VIRLKYSLKMTKTEKLIARANAILEAYNKNQNVYKNVSVLAVSFSRPALDTLLSLNLIKLEQVISLDSQTLFNVFGKKPGFFSHFLDRLLKYFQKTINPQIDLSDWKGHLQIDIEKIRGMNADFQKENIPYWFCSKPNVSRLLEPHGIQTYEDLGKRSAESIVSIYGFGRKTALDFIAILDLAIYGSNPAEGLSITEKTTIPMMPNDFDPFKFLFTKDDDFLNREINCSNDFRRLSNCLLRMDIVTYSDLLSAGPTKISRGRGLGISTMADLSKMVWEHFYFYSLSRSEPAATTSPHPPVEKQRTQFENRTKFLSLAKDAISKTDFSKTLPVSTGLDFARKKLLEKMVAIALFMMDERDSTIFCARYCLPDVTSLKKLSSAFNISRERARQIAEGERKRFVSFVSDSSNAGKIACLDDFYSVFLFVGASDILPFIRFLIGQKGPEGDVLKETLISEKVLADDSPLLKVPSRDIAEEKMIVEKRKPKAQKSQQPKMPLKRGYAPHHLTESEALFQIRNTMFTRFEKNVVYSVIELEDRFALPPKPLWFGTLWVFMSGYPASYLYNDCRSFRRFGCEKKITMQKLKTALDKLVGLNILFVATSSNGKTFYRADRKIIVQSGLARRLQIKL